MISLSAWVLVAIVLVVVALAISVGAAISRAGSTVCTSALLPRVKRSHVCCCAVPPRPHSWHRLLLSMGEGPRLCVTSRAPPSTTTVTS